MLILNEWIMFHIALALYMLGDYLYFSKKNIETNFRFQVTNVFYWISFGIVTNLYLLIAHNLKDAQEFFIAFIIEKTLSIDNLFTFILIFKSFQINDKQQKKILMYGIAGAIIFRGIMIFVGVELIERFEFTIYIFGIFLIIIGAKSFFPSDSNQQNQFNHLEKFLPVSQNRATFNFIVKENNSWKVTYLFLALVAIEFSDIIFAVDSVPAVLAITQNRFIAYSSIICAILGLRSLYFVVKKTLIQIPTMHISLGCILIFIGAKMMLSHWIKIPFVISLGVLALCLYVPWQYNKFKNKA